ncbi:pilus assembly protein TadG-related protein [Enemella sp. A6]|uniref:pilus assembly protein TadG-related protein n=1 Tax=Enemella sp. A6 TaxID=3440152 RepID=UPI003EC0EE66
MTRERDERGNALSVLIVLLIPALIVMIGLVVDGGGRLSAERRAESVAADVARAATDARIRGGEPAARAAAEQRLRAAGVDGTVDVGAGWVTVHTTVGYRPVFLSLIGVDDLPGRGEARARLVPVGP